jgi:hypothetical protein
MAVTAVTMLVMPKSSL